MIVILLNIIKKHKDMTIYILKKKRLKIE